MADKTRSARNPFGFSLKGLKASAYMATGMAIGDDGINAAWDEKLRCHREHDEQPAASGG
jgi:hypothetical protein